MKRFFLLLFIFFTIITLSYAQTKDSNTGIIIKKPLRRLSSRMFKLYNLSADINYSYPFFYSEDFGNNIDNGFIKNVFGSSFSLKSEFGSHLLLDINYSYGEYHLFTLLEDKVYFNDFGVDMSYKLLQNSIFIFYIGVGHKFSSLLIDNDKYKEDVTNTSQSIWKLGTMLTLLDFHHDGFRIYLIGEYKQPFDINSSYSYNQLTLGMGVRFRIY